MFDACGSLIKRQGNDMPPLDTTANGSEKTAGGTSAQHTGRARDPLPKDGSRDEVCPYASEERDHQRGQDQKGGPESYPDIPGGGRKQYPACREQKKAVVSVCARVLPGCGDREAFLGVGAGCGLPFIDKPGAGLYHGAAGSRGLSRKNGVGRADPGAFREQGRGRQRPGTSAKTDPPACGLADGGNNLRKVGMRCQLYFF